MISWVYSVRRRSIAERFAPAGEGRPIDLPALVNLCARPPILAPTYLPVSVCPRQRHAKARYLSKKSPPSETSLPGGRARLVVGPIQIGGQRYAHSQFLTAMAPQAGPRERARPS